MQFSQIGFLGLAVCPYSSVRMPGTLILGQCIRQGPTMDPGDYQPLPSEVHDFVDGRLSPADERDLRARMAANPKLKAQVETLQGAIALLHGMPVREPAAGFEQRVLGRIKTDELAERARRRIKATPAPLWQHIAQVAAGAVAAAVVLAIIGVPGLFEETPQNDGASIELQPVAAQPSEVDLLPVMGDHYSRLQVLRRNLSGLENLDADTQRRLLLLELEVSELPRRSGWLSGEASRLPAEQRLEYVAFIDSLGKALSAVSAEATASREQDRSPDLAQVRALLDKVSVPERLSKHYRFESRFVDDRRAARLLSGGTDANSELSLLAVVRKAQYDNDMEGVVSAAESYMKAYDRGRFADHVHLAAISAMSRLGRKLDAAALYERRFGEYDTDLEPARLALVLRMLTPTERESINKAMDELRSHRRPWQDD